MLVLLANEYDRLPELVVLDGLHKEKPARALRSTDTHDMYRGFLALESPIKKTSSLYF